MEKDRFFGVGEPLIQRQRDQGIDAATYLDLVAGLGCTAYRSWMHITEILDDPSTPNPEAVDMHMKQLDRAAELDIEVTGMSHEWFLPEGCKQRMGACGSKPPGPGGNRSGFHGWGFRRNNWYPCSKGRISRPKP